jgi:hypothetical protein
MSDAYDHEFQPLVSKAADLPYATERPTSKLAVTSLVFGILGLTALPLYGSIVAVATGHAALGQIRESGGRLDGRPMAKVGLGLGYFSIVLALIAGLLLLGYFTWATSPWAWVAWRWPSSRARPPSSRPPSAGSRWSTRWGRRITT